MRLGRTVGLLAVLGLLSWAGPAMAQPVTMLLEFSLDIGSDTEMSDPQMDGDEMFDPGDVHVNWSTPTTPFKNDATIFMGVDPPPIPGVPASRVPVGSADVLPSMWPQYYPQFFDLDGHDQLNEELEYMIPHEEPLPGPLVWAVGQCIWEPRFLQVSFDDDMAWGWIWNNPALGDVPTQVSSPIGMIYGTTAGRDEVVGVNVAFGTGPMPLPVVNSYPYLDEIGVHNLLTPNPDAGNPDDDDVDSLDIVPDEQSCPIWYFTADHEANLNLDPGDIYQVWAGGPPIRVIDDVIHLGLSDDVDIDAFEFAVLPPEGDPSAPGQFLGLLFSVDDDDPVTPQNESGGLDPKMIYASYMTGFSFPFLQQPLADDIDGIALWQVNLGPADLNGPVVVGALSRRTHFPGALDIDLLPAVVPPAGVAVEDRRNGVREIRVKFDELIFLVTGLPADVTLVSNPASPITVAAVSVNPADGKELIVTVNGSTDQTKVRIRFPGVRDYWGNLSASTFCFGILKGDVDASGKVLAADLLSVRSKLTQTVTQALVQYDVDTLNAKINSADMLEVRGNLTKTLPAACPP